MLIRRCRHLLFRSPMMGLILLNSFILTTILFIRLISSSVSFSLEVIGGSKEVSIFEGFDNDKGADDYLIPNIIHFIRIDQTEFSFVDYVTLVAAYRNHGPDFFYIHTNTASGHFSGKYWSLVKRDRQLRKRIRIIPTKKPTQILGHDIFKWPINHRWDVMRFQVLKKYGGIYLDNDMFVLKSLNKYRKFEMALEYDGSKILGHQIIIAHKGARFLDHWIEAYRDIPGDLFFIDGGAVIATNALAENFEWIHQVLESFGTDPSVTFELYNDADSSTWRDLTAIHLGISKRFIMDPNYEDVPIFDENTIKSYAYSFGVMVKELLGNSPLMKD